MAFETKVKIYKRIYKKRVLHLIEYNLIDIILETGMDQRQLQSEADYDTLKWSASIEQHIFISAVNTSDKKAVYNVNECSEKTSERIFKAELIKEQLAKADALVEVNAKIAPGKGENILTHLSSDENNILVSLFGDIIDTVVVSSDIAEIINNQVIDSSTKVNVQH